MAASSQPTSGKFFIFFYFIPFFYTFSLPWCLQQLFPPYFFFAFFFLYSSLLDSLSPVTLSSLLFLNFFFLYPSLLDSNRLQQLSPLCFFSTFFFPYPSILDSISNNSSFSIFFSFTLLSQTLTISQQLSRIFLYFLFLYFSLFSNSLLHPISRA